MNNSKTSISFGAYLIALVGFCLCVILFFCIQTGIYTAQQFTAQFEIMKLSANKDINASNLEKPIKALEKEPPFFFRWLSDETKYFSTPNTQDIKQLHQSLLALDQGDVKQAIQHIQEATQAANSSLSSLLAFTPSTEDRAQEKAQVSKQGIPIQEAIASIESSWNSALNGNLAFKRRLQEAQQNEKQLIERMNFVKKDFQELLGFETSQTDSVESNSLLDESAVYTQGILAGLPVVDQIEDNIPSIKELYTQLNQIRESNGSDDINTLAIRLKTLKDASVAVRNEYRDLKLEKAEIDKQIVDYANQQTASVDSLKSITKDLLLQASKLTE